MKLCRKCHINERISNGLCKDCRNAYERERRLKHGLKRGPSERHRMSHSPEYNSWRAMKKRCYDSKGRDYPLYGGRGIIICEHWRHSFKSFLADMGPRPNGMYLDRINNNGNYEPENCRWATRIEQQNNQRTNHRITMNGETHTLTEWSRLLRGSRDLVFARLRSGWSPEDAIRIPVGGGGGKNPWGARGKPK